MDQIKFLINVMLLCSIINMAYADTESPEDKFLELSVEILELMDEEPDHRKRADMLEDLSQREVLSYNN